MATKKEKTTKEIAKLPVENVETVSKKETAKNSSLDKKAEKQPEAEEKKAKKAPAKKQDKEAVKPAAAKKTAKAKVTKEKSTPKPEASKPKDAITEEAPKVEETPLMDKVEQVAEKVEETVKEVISKVAKKFTKSGKEEDANIEPVAQDSTTVDSATDNAAEVDKTVKVTFQLKYTTHFGERIFITGNSDLLGGGDIEKAHPLEYLNQDYWYTELELPVTNDAIQYSYAIIKAHGEVVHEKRQDKTLVPSDFEEGNVLILDSWSVLDFDQQQSSKKRSKVKQAKAPLKVTHKFEVKVPTLPTGLSVFVTGNTKELGNWNEENLQFLSPESDGVFSVSLDLSKAKFPVSYKYGVYSIAEKTILELESGSDRTLFNLFDKIDYTIVADDLIAVSVVGDKLAV